MPSENSLVKFFITFKRPNIIATARYKKCELTFSRNMSCLISKDVQIMYEDQMSNIVQFNQFDKLAFVAYITMIIIPAI